MAGLGDMMVAGVLRADDYDRAKKFYTDVLGLKLEETTGPAREGRFSAGSGTMVSIYERPGTSSSAEHNVGLWSTGRPVRRRGR